MIFKGIFFALIACFIWGLTFVVPQFMGQFSAMEVTIGRYLIYGLVSLVFFIKMRAQGTASYPKQVWLKALYLSFFSSIGYYAFVVLSLRYSTPAICALILGMCPITIAFYGNLKEKSIPFRRLIIPSLLIILGLAIINIPHFTGSDTPDLFIFGLFCAFASLATWSLYTVGNAAFLKKNPEIPFSNWANLVGVNVLFWTILFAVVLLIFFPEELTIEKFTPLNPNLPSFLMGSAILGILCSWVAIYYWNKASFYLPVSLTGQMLIFQTIFGVLFAYVLEQSLPPLMEGIGIALLLFAVVYGIRLFSREKTTPSASTD